MPDRIDTAAVIDSRDFRAFSSALRALRGIDPIELVAVGLPLDFDDRRRFEDDPYLFFMRADDERAARLWRAMQARMPVELRQREDVSA